MKFLVILAAIAYLALCVAAQSNELPTEEDEANFVEGWKAFRHRMELQDGYWPATCDLSSEAVVKHSACAVHCLFRGKLGGYCNGKGVCVCRN